MNVSASVILYTALLAAASFCLGACPFSVWIGRRALKKDIRNYGDGNPGAANVFRAGSRKWGMAAVLLDIAKGIPFVLVAHLALGLSVVSVVIVGLAAILGHAFSPLLGWRGGKAIAVTFGVMMALPTPEILLAFAACIVLGVLFLTINSWGVIFGGVGALAYLIIARAESWEVLFMACALAVLVVKHLDDLRTVPAVKFRFSHWLQIRR